MDQYDQGNNYSAIDAPFDAGYLPQVPILSAHPVPENKGVPVVLQPVDLSTGETVANQTPLVFPTAPLLGHHVEETSVDLSTGETVVNQTPPGFPMPVFPTAPLQGNQAQEASVDLSTGETVTNQTPPVFSTVPLQAYKGKQVYEASTSNASKPNIQVETDGNNVLPSPTTSNQERPSLVSVEILLQAEANALKLPCSPLEILVAEVVSRYLRPSQSNKSQMANENEINYTEKIRMEKLMNEIMNGISDMDDLFTEPLPTVQADRNSPASQPKPFENFATGNMTEPLQDDGGQSNVGDRSDVRGRRKRACTICGQEGHNRKTCRKRQT